MAITEIAASVGALLVITAYLPQITRIIKMRCAYGVSPQSWAIWLLAALLILPYALVLSDPIFIVLQTISITAIVTTLALTLKFSDPSCTVCRVHGR